MKQLKYLLILACVACMFSSCAKDSTEQMALPDGMLAIQLSLPDSKTVDTRAITDQAQESVISNVTLLFYSGNILVNKLSSDGNSVLIEPSRIVFRVNELDYTKPYYVIVLANVPGSILPVVGSDMSSLYEIYSEISGKLLLGAGFTMWGVIGNHNFSTNPIASVSLVRQAVKFRVKVKIDDRFINKYKITAIHNEMVLSVNNLPNRSFIYGFPNATRFKNLNASLMSHDYADFTLQSGVPTTEAYGYENLVSGQGDSEPKIATNFILKLPYIITYPDGATRKVTENYYKVYIDQPTSGDARYATTRNNLYDVTVMVHGFGGPVPQTDGFDVVTKVLPWNAVTNPITPPDKPTLELSNTKFEFYGDIKDNVVVATYRTSRPMREPLTITARGDGFTVADQSLEVVTKGHTPELNTSYDLVVNVKKLGKNGEIDLTYAGYTHTISVSADYDNLQRTYNDCLKGFSDVHWCTLSPNKQYVQSEQKQALYPNLIDSTKPATLYLNINKTTLRDNARMGTVMLTKSDNTVTRVVVLQKPYETPTPTKTVWAKGNITLGNNSKGEQCYVIGGAGDYGLWFRYMKAWGYVHESGDDKSWDPNTSSYYTPQKNGDKVTVVKGAITEYTKIFMAEYPGYTDSSSGEQPNKFPSDPCSLVYTSDPKVKWRTPTQEELEGLIGSTDWVTTSSGAKGLLCSDGVFLRCAGGRHGGLYNSKILGTGATPATRYFTSSVNKIDLVPNGSRAWGIRMEYNKPPVVEDIVMNTISSVRCVRDI